MPGGFYYPQKGVFFEGNFMLSSRCEKKTMIIKAKEHPDHF